jgi:hypothetical protein
MLAWCYRVLDAHGILNFTMSKRNSLTIRQINFLNECWELNIKELGRRTYRIDCYCKLFCEQLYRIQHRKVFQTYFHGDLVNTNRLIVSGVDGDFRINFLIIREKVTA